ncbi:serine-rich adhesin for platelets-like [Oppia nitens]|uniref:serine-rich adhesin for platelets-like n=1 Tax=Oppia nitens TaxID=1686743 RepID=UPI0023DAF148|nr:serine-rich adhesin for platelets-like [Oppia nitens]
MDKLTDSSSTANTKKCTSTDVNSDGNDSRGFEINLTEIQRDLRRLQVTNDSDQVSHDAVVANIGGNKHDSSSINSHHNNNSCNYFTLKSTPYSPKLSCHERRQSFSAVRRLHRSHPPPSAQPSTSSSSSLKMGTDSQKQQSSDVNENTIVSKEVDNTIVSTSTTETPIYCDFKDLAINSVKDSDSNDRSENDDKILYFKKHFRLESSATEWREKTTTTITDTTTTTAKPSVNVNSCGVENCIRLKPNKIRKLRFKDDKTCARQALCDSSLGPTGYPSGDESVEELAAYFDDTLYLPRKMSFMARSIYS